MHNNHSFGSCNDKSNGFEVLAGFKEEEGGLRSAKALVMLSIVVRKSTASREYGFLQTAEVEPAIDIMIFEIPGCL